MSIPLKAEEFSDFFCELWGEQCDAFPWQKEFARRACAGDWPKYVAAPTGSGKTACLDAAVFALAFQAALPATERTAGRRIFFIVNRRVIVDEAYERAGMLCQKLTAADPASVAGRVAAALRSLGGEDGAHPLSRTQLRGGIYRDRSWAGSLHQPMIICSTVDQAGSRLLFRGYGVSDHTRPIHAALVSQDSTLIVDEAHISRPFIETLGWVEKYRRYEPPGSTTVRLPFQCVQMTATLPAAVTEAEQIALSDADREHRVLSPRLKGSKPVRLVVEDKARGKVREATLAKRLAMEAQKILSEQQPRSLAVMVNRVATARLVHAELKKLSGARVSLLIGRLRPLDRKELTAEIQARLKTRHPAEEVPTGGGDAPEIVVSTQCLEVGADLDFDALVTEAASLDALRQRFGRLNRGGRQIVPHAAIVLPADQLIAPDKVDEEKPCDPIYGNATPRTWHWLQSIAAEQVVDFGVDAMAAQVANFRATCDDETFAKLLSPAMHAPILLPAYLDCWVQTNPAPAADPHVALFLHGPQRDMVEVQICWRADLPADFDPAAWIEILSLCPPTTAECLPVPLHIFRKWAASERRITDSSGDAEERVEAPEREELEAAAPFAALIWQGPEKSRGLKTLGELAPGHTLVLRAQTGGWETLGILPEAPADPALTPETSLEISELRLVDVAEQASAEARRRAILRFHPSLWPEAAPGSAAAALLAMANDALSDRRSGEIRELLGRLLTEENSGWKLRSREQAVIRHLASAENSDRLAIDNYPDDIGFVVSARQLLPPEDQQNFESMDVEAEALIESREPQELSAHTSDVLDRIARSLALLPLESYASALIAAARLHDWGKADVRFQALLRSSSVFAAMASSVVLAKSGNLTPSVAARREARERAELPDGFRHEMLSVQMAQTATADPTLPTDASLRALTLHLIAAHHGHARPFAPVVIDEAPLDVRVALDGKDVLLPAAERLAHPADALDSGIADRFWQLTRRHGWWGLALLEAVLRLADQQASAQPQTKSPNEH